jgi:hypothetical protein
MPGPLIKATRGCLGCLPRRRPSDRRGRVAVPRSKQPRRCQAAEERAAGRALAQGLDFRTPCIFVPPGWGRNRTEMGGHCLASPHSRHCLADVAPSRRHAPWHVYRRQPAADEISEGALFNVRTIANTAADKSDDILNKPRYYIQRRWKEACRLCRGFHFQEFGARSC